MSPTTFEDCRKVNEDWRGLRNLRKTLTEVPAPRDVYDTTATGAANSYHSSSILPTSSANRLQRIRFSGIPWLLRHRGNLSLQWQKLVWVACDFQNSLTLLKPQWKGITTCVVAFSYGQDRNKSMPKAFILRIRLCIPQGSKYPIIIYSPKS